MLPSQTIKWLTGLQIFKPGFHAAGIVSKPAEPAPAPTPVLRTPVLRTPKLAPLTTVSEPFTLPSKSQRQLLQLTGIHRDPRPRDLGLGFAVGRMTEHQAVHMLAAYAKTIDLTVQDGRQVVRATIRLDGTYEFVRRMLELLGDRMTWLLKDDAQTFYLPATDENHIQATLEIETKDDMIAQALIEKFQGDEQEARINREKREAARLEAVRVSAAEAESQRIERERMDKYAEEAMF